MSQNIENQQQIMSGHSNSFDTGIAEILGLHAAIVFNHIVYWLKINSSKEKSNFYEGKYWMYETQKQMADYFGYLREDDIWKAIKKLLDAGLIIKGNFNKNPFDKTAWYTTSDQTIFLGKREIKEKFTKPLISGIDNVTQRNPERSIAECNITINNQEEHIDCIEPSAEIAIFDCHKNKTIVTKDHLYFICSKFKFDWTVEEVEYLYLKLSKHRGIVSDLTKFCSAIIDKKRMNEKLEQSKERTNNKKTKRHIPEHEKIPARKHENLKTWAQLQEEQKNKSNQ